MKAPMRQSKSGLIEEWNFSVHVYYMDYIPEKVIARMRITHQGKAEVHNHVRRVDIFYYNPLRDLVFINFYYTKFPVTLWNKNYDGPYFLPKLQYMNASCRQRRNAG